MTITEIDQAIKKLENTLHKDSNTLKTLKAELLAKKQQLLKGTNMKNTIKINPNQQMQYYILNAINGESYDYSFNSNKDKIEFFFKTFRNEYGFLIERYGLQKALTEYLQGLPSTLNIAFYYWEIREKLLNFGFITENTSEKYIEYLEQNWFKLLAENLISLASYKSTLKYSTIKKDWV